MTNILERSGSWLPPVFLKHTDIGEEERARIKDFDICTRIVEEIDRKELAGVQKDRL